MKNNQPQAKAQQEAGNSQIGEESPAYVKLDVRGQGKVSFAQENQDINLVKAPTLKNLSKRNIVAIDTATQNSIRKVLFQNVQNKYFPDSWQQGFSLQKIESTFYGLKQKEGGPCGVIACVQAYFLKYLFFTQKPANVLSTICDNDNIKQNCLVAALANILWKVASDRSQIRLALIQQHTSNVAAIEHCGQVVLKVSSFTNLYEQLYEYKDEFIGDFNNGFATFLYSVILTKGVERLIAEFDTPECSLIGQHGHCSQEQVNLFLTGRGTTNAFDGEKDCGGINLKGVDKRSEFGFLTIFEHYKYFNVEHNYKCPLYPIWVICKEYHYSIVFGKEEAIIHDSIKKFDLVFYDQLHNPEDRIILTLTRGQKQQAQDGFMGWLANSNANAEDEDGMTSMIVLVLRTKWGAPLDVNWNGSEVIL